MFQRLVVRGGRVARPRKPFSAPHRFASTFRWKPFSNYSMKDRMITAVLTGIIFVTCQPYLMWPWDNKPDYCSTRALEPSQAPKHDITKRNIEAARAQFISICGEGGVSDHPGELKSRTSSEWSPSPVDTTASLIVYPRTTEDVSEIMKVCHTRNIPVTAYSGGTSLDGALASTRGGICIDFRRMNKILAIHKDDLDVVVQPAVGWQELNTVLAPEKLFFPVDPGPGAQIGGMIATGCSGTNAYRYGPMKDWVLSCTIVLADGTVVKTRHRPRKSTAGYDLTRLMVSSSGTLGLVTEATLKITATPQNPQVALAAFPSTSNAVRAVIEMLQTGLQTEALELMDSLGMRATNASGYTSHTYKETPTLFLKFAGTNPATVAEQVAAVQALVSRHGCEKFEASSAPEEMDAIWSARKTFLWSFLGLKKKPEDSFLSADIAVPISKLGLMIDECEDYFAREALVGNTMGHVGDGNFHLSILYADEEREKAERCILWARRRAIELEGTVTGEHGVGLSLRDVLEEEVGVNGTDMMRKIKFALDPKCLLNCDKIVRIEKGAKH